MAVGDIWQVTQAGRLQGSLVENVLHYRETVVFTLDTVSDTINNYWDGTIGPALTNLQSSDQVWEELRVQKIYPLPVLVPMLYPKALPGVLAGASLPSSVCLNLKKLTAKAGRAYRGRLYLAGIPEGVLVAATGRWTGVYLTVANVLTFSLYQDIVEAGAGTGELEPILYHRTTHLWDVLASVVPDGVPRNQRRRQPGRGV